LWGGVHHNLYLKDVFFHFSEKSEAADGVIREYVSDKCYRLHLFDLKKTMAIRSWKRAGTQ